MPSGLIESEERPDALGSAKRLSWGPVCVVGGCHHTDERDSRKAKLQDAVGAKASAGFRQE